MSLPTGPTFVGIGMMKAGTTLVHELLDRHPDAAMPRWNKEVSFFDLHHERGPDWYRGHFEPGDRPVVAWGDLTPGYVLSAAARSRLAALEEPPTLVVCLRDPVARIRSQYLHDRATLGTGLDFGPYVEADYNRVLSRSRYGELLEPWFETFGVDRFHVFVLERYRTDPVREAGALFARLGLAALSADELASVGRVNEAVAPRNRLVAGTAHRVQLVLRRRGLHGAASRLAGTAAFRRMLFRSGRPEPVEAALPEGVAADLAVDSARLADRLRWDRLPWETS